ncbi:hypothetical protein [Sphingomonas colocasiae]|uniref:Tetratricopeptide repeat protein n=1 Tax=Sphingomonas colocasiae TaxID=1848973 RepID=A0ABS7PZZ8_9SPHN|nr:hypothetical protein [Sphingomonas colocasiae]MBY8825569.1 hypothetical protein [Sphingomonas colocasiae]
MTDSLCAEDALQDIILTAQADSARAVDKIDQLLQKHPGDARLHFLKGSLLVELKRHFEAHRAMSQAIAIAPDFEIARFQLGFFELTSGEADRAIETWRPLKDLPIEHYLRRFVVGLEHLIDDRFEQCVTELGAGIAANTENLPLNRDMELIIARCAEILTPNADATQKESDVVSATSFLLGSKSR